MARLTGPEDRFLELKIPKYVFPGDGSRTSDNDWDANWLVVDLKARDGERQWSTTDSAFLTWELRELSEWLRALADGASGVPQVFLGIEPNLNFEAEGKGESTLLRVFFEQGFRPPGVEIGGQGVIEFTPGAEALRRFADELEETLRTFPIRVVEEDGPARRNTRADDV